MRYDAAGEGSTSDVRPLYELTMAVAEGRMGKRAIGDELRALFSVGAV